MIPKLNAQRCNLYESAFFYDSSDSVLILNRKNFYRISKIYFSLSKHIMTNH